MSWKKAISLTLLIILVTASGIYFFSPSRETNCSSIDQPVSSGKLEFMQGRSPLDTSVIVLNNTPYFLLAYMTGVQSTYSSTPVTIFPLKEGKMQIEKARFFGESEHIRHFVKVNTPWGEGILMADHGKDGGTFDGGKLLLVVEEQNALTDKSATLNQPRNFTFNVAGIKNPQTSYDDFLIVPFNGPGSKLSYLSFDGKAYTDKSEILPEEWRRFSVCFMTAMPVDVDQDGREEIALGACDLNKNQNPQARDRLLSFKNGRWVFEKEAFPLRKKEATWGTVFWLRDGNNLFALTHNKGFTEADIQFFTYDQNQRKFSERPVFLKKNGRKEPHYFHKMVKFKNDFYTLIRYANSVNNVPNLLALKRDSQGEMKETDVCLALPKREVLLGIDTFVNEKGTEQLLLTYYSGRYEIYQ